MYYFSCSKARKEECSKRINGGCSNPLLASTGFCHHLFKIKTWFFTKLLSLEVCFNDMNLGKVLWPLLRAFISFNIQSRNFDCKPNPSKTGIASQNTCNAVKVRGVSSWPLLLGELLAVFFRRLLYIFLNISYLCLGPKFLLHEMLLLLSIKLQAPEQNECF